MSRWWKALGCGSRMRTTPLPCRIIQSRRHGLAGGNHLPNQLPEWAGESACPTTTQSCAWRRLATFFGMFTSSSHIRHVEYFGGNAHDVRTGLVWSSISAAVIPSARQDRMKDTENRVPRIASFRPRSSGSAPPSCSLPPITSFPVAIVVHYIYASPRCNLLT